MHYWGDENVDWEGINKAAEYIGLNLRIYGRVGVTDYKEKFGTVRVYCHFGVHSLFSITHPGYCFSRYPKWLWDIDCLYLSRVIPLLCNWWIVPYQKWLYRKLYSDMVKKYPHLHDEILVAADYDNLLLGL